MLTINKTIEDGKAVFQPEGRLDTVTAPDLEKEVRDCIDNLTELVFDFKDLDYISSAGLRILLASQKIMLKQGTMKVVNVNSTIMEIFDVTGFSDILTIE